MTRDIKPANNTRKLRFHVLRIGHLLRERLLCRPSVRTTKLVPYRITRRDHARHMHGPAREAKTMPAKVCDRLTLSQRQNSSRLTEMRAFRPGSATRLASALKA